MLGGASDFSGRRAPFTGAHLSPLDPLYCVLTVVFPTSAFLDAAHLLQVTAYVLGPPRRRFDGWVRAHKAACHLRPMIRLLP